jgi:hypothetical protein
MYQILHIPSGCYVKYNAYELYDAYRPGVILNSSKNKTAPVVCSTEQEAKQVITNILLILSEALDIEFEIIKLY